LQPISVKSRHSYITVLLLFAVCVLAATMAALHVASWLEAASFITGAICVWLTVKESIWNFPLGLANVATFGIVFYQSRLFADAGLQVVYFMLGVVGWYLWLHGGEHRAPLTVTRASHWEMGMLAALVVVATLGLWHLLRPLGGSASFWDALTTSISLASQWLLNRKRLESWIGWIIVDVIYVPLYLSKDLYLTAILYGIFLLLAVMGLRTWSASLRQRFRTGDLELRLGESLS
jgi:nicotinamide mononucleotide transporter